MKGYREYYEEQGDRDDKMERMDVASMLKETLTLVLGSAGRTFRCRYLCFERDRWSVATCWRNSDVREIFSEYVG